MLTSITEQECNDTDIRLVGGSRPNEGRVEYCIEGVWGTVCDDFGDRNYALVICRQLELPTESKQGQDCCSYVLTFLQLCRCICVSSIIWWMASACLTGECNMYWQ